MKVTAQRAQVSTLARLRTARLSRAHYFKASFSIFRPVRERSTAAPLVGREVIARTDQIALYSNVHYQRCASAVS